MTPAETWAVVLLVLLLGATFVISRGGGPSRPDRRPRVPTDDRHLVDLVTRGLVTPEDLLGLERIAIRRATTSDIQERVR
jgi:hypothetical protein